MLGSRDHRREVSSRNLLAWIMIRFWVVLAWSTVSCIRGVGIEIYPSDQRVLVTCRFLDDVPLFCKMYRALHKSHVLQRLAHDLTRQRHECVCRSTACMMAKVKELDVCLWHRGCHSEI